MWHYMIHATNHAAVMTHPPKNRASHYCWLIGLILPTKASVKFLTYLPIHMYWNSPIRLLIDNSSSEWWFCLVPWTRSSNSSLLHTLRTHSVANFTWTAQSCSINGLVTLVWSSNGRREISYGQLSDFTFRLGPEPDNLAPCSCLDFTHSPFCHLEMCWNK